MEQKTDTAQSPVATGSAPSGQASNASASAPRTGGKYQSRSASFGPREGGRPGGRDGGRDGRRSDRGPRRGDRRDEKPADEFEQRIIDIARVTRVMAGGKRMRFRACVAIGDKKGNVAIGLAKGADVTLAVAKAVNQAKKAMVVVPIVKGTIPHAVDQWYGSAHILLKPAAAGKGIIGGGIVRTILELSGIRNVSSKILGTNNKVNNAKCVIEAIKFLRAPKAKKEKAEKTEKSEMSENATVAKPSSQPAKTEKKSEKKEDKKAAKGKAKA